MLNQVERGYRVAMPTPELNRVLRAAVTRIRRRARDGRPVRLFYVTQTRTAPPEVTVFASAPARVPEAYRRYLRTRFDEAFGLVGVPLRVRFRARREEAVTAPRTGGRGRRSSPPRSAAARGRRR